MTGGDFAKLRRRYDVKSWEIRALFLWSDLAEYWWGGEFFLMYFGGQCCVFIGLPVASF